MLIFTLAGSVVISHDTGLKPESIFKEYSFNKIVTSFKGEFAYADSFFIDLNVDDLDDAIDAEIALKFWGGHIGTSDQTFKVNGSKKFNFPQPKTPGNPYCFFRTVLGNPPIKIPVELLMKGKNRFTFFCGEQVCYSFNWPLYWLYSFTIRIYYNDTKKCVRGIIKKEEEIDTAYNWVGFRTDVDDPAMVESIEYIGYYEDYDLDGDGNPAGWHYMINNGIWEGIIGKQYLPPYNTVWSNYWVPQQYGAIKIIAKINSKSGLSYLTQAIEYNSLRQIKSIVKMYKTERLDEYFGVRIGERKECNIPINDSLSNAISAYIVLSTWSGESDDGAIHVMGINGKMLAESPGKLHDWAFLRIPVPIEYLKNGDNTFFIYSETDGHAFEVNFPGPSILIRYSDKANIP
jgi:hypothetical protein